ncbi:MAG: hypothetical protein LBQ35_03115 [Spirochaetaceae bacterium]|jgi:hypothetical protein|nr:hypothetical protein [Spirochaetaceae bacterium]
MKRLIFAGLLFSGIVFAVFGADSGFTLHQNPELNGAGRDTDFSYTWGIAPWVSASLSENLDVYFSGSLAFRHESETWKVIPELSRFMVSWRPLPVLGIDAGRIRFTDSSGVLAAGLFDGISGMYTLGSTRLTLGAYYTGLLYRDTADIFMSAGDTEDYARELDYNNFGNTYFASRRFLAALGWEAPALGSSPHGLSLQALAQFDLNGRDEKIHTQYLSARFLFSPVPVFDLSLGGVAGFAETAGLSGTEISFALPIGVSWTPPSSLRDVVTLGFRWGSGRVNERIGPFRPVTTISQGNVLDAGLGGLMVINGAYTLSPADTLSLSLEGRYFLRSDVKTYANARLKGGDEKALGAEAYGSITWVPMVDLSLTGGVGVFVPGTGNALDSGAPVLWKAALALLLSF